MALRHLAWSVLAHVLLAVHGNSGDDGSAGGSAAGPERCIEPDPRPKPLGTGILEVEIQSRCYLNCIEKIFLQEDITLEVSTQYPAWPVIPDSVLERNCSINAMVKKCRLGCSQLKYGHCLRKCSKEDCMEDDAQNCQICNRDYCNLGCEIHLAQGFNITNDTQTEGTPPSPVGPLELRAAEGLADYDFRSTSDAGLYYMDPVNAVPAEESSDETRYPTVPIIRVTLGRKIKYIWMANFDGILNLTAYACKEVYIVLGVVNKFGFSRVRFDRITLLPLEVHGENPPTFASHPDGVSTSIESDTRPGYWKHAVINLSWKRPRRGFGLLDHYVVTFKLDTKYDQPYCKQESKTVHVNKTLVEDVKFTIKADALEDGPVSDCHYTVQIKSVSVDRNIPTPPADIHDVHVNSSHTIPVPLNLTCNRTWDEKSGHFTYKLDWVMPDDMNVRSAVGSCEVTVYLIGPDDLMETLYTTTFPANMSTYQYIQKVRYDMKNYNHRIIMRSKPGDQSLLVIVPAPHVCEWPAEAIPPPQVGGVAVELTVTEGHSSNSSKTLDLVATWNPTAMDTENIFYQLRVVTQNTTRNDIRLLHLIETSEAQAVISGLKISIDHTGPYLYIQVKAVSRFLAEGHWSEPVRIELLRLISTPLSTPSPSPVPLHTAVPSPSPVPLDTAVPSPSPMIRTHPESVRIDPVNATAVRISWEASPYLSTLLKYTSYFAATGAVMSEYETVLPPGVASTEITLEDEVDGYEHNFTLFYIKPCDDTVAPATFSFDRKYFQIQFGPTDYCLNWGTTKTGRIEAQLQFHLTRIIREHCTDCNKFTALYFRNGRFHCHSNPTIVSYRSSLINPFPSTNSTYLVGIIQSWVSTGPSLTIDRLLVRVSPNCPTHIACIEEDECVDDTVTSGSGAVEKDQSSV